MTSLSAHLGLPPLDPPDQLGVLLTTAGPWAVLDALAAASGRPESMAWTDAALRALGPEGRAEVVQRTLTRLWVAQGRDGRPGLRDQRREHEYALDTLVRGPLALDWQVLDGLVDSVWTRKARLAALRQPWRSIAPPRGARPGDAPGESPARPTDPTPGAPDGPRAAHWPPPADVLASWWQRATVEAEPDVLAAHLRWMPATRETLEAWIQGVRDGLEAPLHSPPGAWSTLPDCAHPNWPTPLPLTPHKVLRALVGRPDLPMTTLRELLATRGVPLLELQERPDALPLVLELLDGPTDAAPLDDEVRRWTLRCLLLHRQPLPPGASGQVARLLGAHAADVPEALAVQWLRHHRPSWPPETVAALLHTLPRSVRLVLLELQAAGPRAPSLEPPRPGGAPRGR